MVLATVDISMSDATLGGLVEWATDALARTSETPRLDAELLLAKAAGVRRSTILAFPERSVARTAHAELERLVERRRDDVPVAYLLGEREFYSLRLDVRPGVLVPRPETELVVEAALDVLGVGSRARLLDLGTGSGAIALAIKHARPAVEVTGIDNSAAALELARKNALALEIDVRFLESDWFERIGDERFDVIVSNPPYVRRDDPALSGALRHEPVAALDGGPDGLDAIRHIVATADSHMLVGGRLIVEHAETQGAAVRALAAARAYREIRTLRDLAGRERVLVAEAP